MRVLIVFQSDVTRAAERIVKVGKSLVAAGHQVSVLCNSRRIRARLVPV